MSNKDYFNWIKATGAYNLSNKSELEKLQDEIVKTNNSSFAYFCAKEYPYKTYKMQEVVLKNKKPAYVFLFAKNIPGADKKALESVLFNSRNIPYLSAYLLSANKVDKRKELENAVLDSKNIKWISKLAYNHYTLQKSKCNKIILDSKNPKYLYELSKTVESKSIIKKIEKALIEVGHLTYIRLFAANIDGANIKKLEAKILESGNMKEIKKFAKSVKQSTMRRFLLIA